MPYGILKVDTITFTAGGVDTSVSISGLVQNPTFTGNITSTGTISGNIIRGGTTVSGATVTGTAGQFGTLTGNTAGFTTVTGTTVTGATANFTTLSGTTATITSGVFASGTAAAPSVSVGTTTNGLFSSGANEVAISTGGSGRLFINSTGNVLLENITSIDPNFLLQSNASSTGIKGIGVNNNGGYGVYLTYDNTARYGGGAAVRNIANSPLIFETNNTERVRISATGLVGIGSSTPGAILDVAPDANRNLQVQGKSGTTYGLELKNGTANVGGEFHITAASSGGVVFNRGTTEMARLNQNGLGIGTTTPQNLFVISNGGANGLEFNPTTESGTANYVISYNRTAAAYRDLRFDAAATRFEIGGNEAARIDSSRRLLVGTSSTSAITSQVIQGNSGNTAGNALLTLARGTNAPASGNSLGAISFSDSNHGQSALISADRDGGTWTSGSSQPSRLVFSTTADGASSPTEAMRITSGQNVRIGTTAEGSGFSSGRLRLVGNTGGINSFYAEQSTAGGYCYISNAVSNGGTFYHINFFEAGTARGSITSNGSATAYNTSSDYRLKENIAPMEGATERLLSLKPSRFNFIDFPDRTVDGFIAHEVQTVVPEAIVGEKDAVDVDGNPIYQGIDQSKLVPLLTAALQEAVAKIESLEARLTAAGI